MQLLADIVEYYRRKRAFREHLQAYISDNEITDVKDVQENENKRLWI
jgi:hypothetical protein